LLCSLRFLCFVSYIPAPVFKPKKVNKLIKPKEHRPSNPLSEYKREHIIDNHYAVLYASVIHSCRYEEK
jgi:hypothetical protein